MNAPIEGFAVSELSAIESEQTVLGGLMLDPFIFDVVGNILQPADFFSQQHQIAYTAIVSLIVSTKACDVLTVWEQCKREVELPYLNSLAQYVPSPASARRHAEIIRERAMSRKMLAISSSVQQLASEHHTPIEERIEQATAHLMKLAEGAPRDEWKSVQDGAVRLLDRINDANDPNHVPDFIPTGLKDLDERLDGGMRDGELIVIGARPSMGKSALALSIMAHCSGNLGLPSGIFSMEMPEPQLTNRLMSIASHIHLSRLRRPEWLKDHDWPNVTSGVEKLRHWPIYINDQSGLNINQLRAKARSLKRQKKVRVLAVDYLGLMNGTDPKMPRAYQLEEVTKGLKGLAKELGIPVLLLVQLKRSVEDRPDQMPMLSDIRDAGSVEQDADVVMFVHRPYKADPMLGADWKYFAKVNVAKLRDGDPGYLDLQYVGENTRFMDWPEDTAKPEKKAKGRTSL